MIPKPEDVRSILATDCGSTTTKAILIERGPDGYRLRARGEAPTTVEAPFEDVTRGVLNAVREVEELRGRKLLEGDRILSPQQGDDGVDLYLSTSSAGGGLQMMVSGLVMQMTGESAQRAALGAGAIVMDVMALNDGRRPHEKIRRLRQLRPDMILLSGGTDGGDVKRVAEMAELLAAADPRARLGAGYELPVIYAGNEAAASIVRGTLAGQTALSVVANLRPTLERENLQPARDAIHDLFMEHVMAHAPGYAKLMSWSPVPIMPTPGAVGLIIEKVARRDGVAVVGVDIGGATTDVFSVFRADGEPVFNRTVSANLGMSYSISNVMAEAGIENILRWVPFAVDEAELRNRIKNKMIRPTTIPQTLDDLVIEQAICREALRLSFEQHRSLAVGLKGRQQVRDISDAIGQSASGKTLVDLMELGLLVGSGGVLSHAPRRQQAMLMMIDAFLPEGITELAVDSIFMTPQLGVLSTVHEEAATQVFERDCLIVLGACVAPVGPVRAGQPCMTVEAKGAGAPRRVHWGELALLPGVAGTVRLLVTPERGVDVGAGRGKAIERDVRAGGVGIVLDARGRHPLPLPVDADARRQALRAWNRALDVYPREL